MEDGGQSAGWGWGGGGGVARSTPRAIASCAAECALPPTGIGICRPGIVLWTNQGMAIAQRARLPFFPPPQVTCAPTAGQTPAIHPNPAVTPLPPAPLAPAPTFQQPLRSMVAPAGGPPFHILLSLVSAASNLKILAYSLAEGLRVVMYGIHRQCRDSSGGAVDGGMGRKGAEDAAAGTVRHSSCRIGLS